MTSQVFDLRAICTSAVIIVMVVAGSGSQAQLDEDIDMAANQAAAKVRCTIAVSETPIGVDQHVRLNVVWENVGDQSVHWWVKGTSDAIDWKVTRPGDRPVLLTEYGRSVVGDAKEDEQSDTEQASVNLLVRLTLDPGDKHTEQYIVSRIWDMTVSGEYKIEIEREFVAADGSRFKVRSQPVTVFIKEVLLRPKSPSPDEENSRPVDGDSEASNPDP